MKYSIQETVSNQAAHHESIEALWRLVWKKRCALGIYPFMEAKLEDFEGTFNHLIQADHRPPYDFDQIAETFFPVAEELDSRGDAAEKEGNLTLACELYLRAAAVYRIARFPFPISERQLHAWKCQKAVFFKGARLLNPPMHEVWIPHVHGVGEEVNSQIPVCVRVPGHQSPAKFPTILQIYGLDGYRTEFTRKSNDHIRCGYASIAVEIPGTGDCPAAIQDPTSPDRLWSSVLDWLERQDWVDRSRIVVWGVSTGGYYAARLAHTHCERVAAVIAQGAGVHYMFEPEWLDLSSRLDYPFDLTYSLAVKFGYKDVESMKKDALQRFSLLANGLLDQPSSKLFLVNGMNDQIFPIEDSFLMLQHGSVKEARFVQGLGHMAEPAATKIISEWLAGFFRTFAS